MGKPVQKAPMVGNKQYHYPAAELGEAGDGAGHGVEQIDEEIAEIKRYEVSSRGCGGGGRCMSLEA